MNNCWTINYHSIIYELLCTIYNSNNFEKYSNSLIYLFVPKIKISYKRIEFMQSKNLSEVNAVPP